MANNNLIENGSLKVSVFERSFGMPVENALVRITPIANPEAVIEELTTDISGQTPIIELPTPPIDYSLSPEQPKPFSSYDIYVTKEGYELSFIKGVQLFSSINSQQEVILAPLENTEGIITKIIINDPVLWGDFPPKIPELPVKILPNRPGFIVLDKPVIPEFIIVHDGVPNDSSANNYYVPYKDYIKNVACCEIYSTWPIEALKANIFAIMSLTLNRVYTEWYRSQGYNFTITNSTAYDQAFNYGRTIFKSISDVVDSIFTTYITKPAIKQPLFSQYNDGINVSRPNWLSQWGSKSLGDEGVNALDILKNYYGPEIFLAQAEKVSGIPSSFPGVDLQLGSSGKDVRTIQEQLNAISNNYPAIPKLAVDGTFGETTKTAVETFQKIFSLPETGIVDFPTWYKISFIFTAVKGLAK